MIDLKQVFQIWYSTLIKKQNWTISPFNHFKSLIPPMKISQKIILALSVTLMAGYTWSLDMPLALEVPLRQQPYNFSNFDFSLLYFSTYITVCFFDVTVGVLLDKYSVQKTVVWITSVCLASQIAIFAMFYSRFPGYKFVLYLMRGIYGATGSALFAVQALLITKYGGKHYDTLIGMGVCLPFLFDSLNNIFTPLMYNSTQSMELVWGVGIAFCAIALLSSVLISRMVQTQQKEEDLAQENGNKSIQKDEGANFKGLKAMPREFWIIIGAVLFFQLCIATYIDNLNDCLVKRFQFSYVTAGYFLFIPYGVAAIFSLIIGSILVRKPMLKRKIIVGGSMMFSLGILGTFFLENIDKNKQVPSLYYAVVGVQFLTISLMMSILYGCLSSSIKYVVDENHLGVGWGVIGSTVGLSEAIGPVIAGLVLSSTENLGDGYKRLTLCVFLVSLVAVMFSLWIYLGKFEKIDVNSTECVVASDLSDSLLDHKDSQILNPEVFDDFKQDLTSI